MVDEVEKDCTKETECLRVKAEEHLGVEDSGSAKVLERYLQSLRKLSQNISLLESMQHTAAETETRRVQRNIVPHVLLVLPAHLGKHYWTSARSREEAKGLLKQVLRMCGCRSPLELLAGESVPSADKTSPYLPMEVGTEEEERTIDERNLDGGDGECPGSTQQPNNTDQSPDHYQQSNAVLFPSGFIKPLLSLVKTKLSKHSLKSWPTDKHSLVWCLRQLTHPHVAPLLDSLLPPLLMLLDDHETEHKALGLRAVTHLVKNIDPTELRWYGRAEVIYQAIKNFLYIREGDIIAALHPCLLHLLPVLEGPQPRTIQGPMKHTKTDEVLTILLNSLHLESKIEIRKAYSFHIRSYIELLNIFVVRHMKLLLDALLSCMELPDYSGEETRLNALTALASLISYAWPRIPLYRSKIDRALLKLVADLCPSNTEVPDKAEIRAQLLQVVQCFVLLARCCHDQKDIYVQLLNGCDHSGLADCLQQTLKQLE
ncbi:hypothetical protein EMCRGX_G011782 [Ephydatia muelleri]|eukprot:Em0006g662a